MEQGFVKGAADNLPKVDAFMIDDFYRSNLDFLSAEVRNVKSSRSGRESYGDSAIGYVQLKRDASICTIKAKITPEHKVHSKYYLVEASINEAEENVISCGCVSCSASAGGCKHGVAFLCWLHRRSEEPSVTSTACYWRAPSLSKAGKAIKYMDLAGLVDRAVPGLKPKSGEFLDQVIQNMIRAEGTIFDIFRPVTNENCSIFHMYLKYKKDINADSRNADNFIAFMSNQMTPQDCSYAEKSSRQQAHCREWYELRSGRTTASKIYKASRCKTKEGALTEVIFGASTFHATAAITRGRQLEPEVLKEVAKIKKWRIKASGLILNERFPIFGASPDGVTPEYVIEVKCPSKEGTVRQYVDNGVVAPKYFAQIQLQMFFAKKQKGLFCLASPDFETTRQVTTFEVRFDQNYCEDLMENSGDFWKNVIYPVLEK